MPITSKTIAIAVAAGVVIIGAIAYLYYMQSNSAPTVSKTAGPASQAEATFLNLAARINDLSFDTQILSDARFMALQDIHTSIVPETSGRKDPFAPLAGVVSSQ